MSDTEDLFWDCAAELYNIDGVRESTIFGFKCLRVESEFVALPANDSLWVKLPEDHVNDLIDAGIGEECKPNGRVFREWVAISMRRCGSTSVDSQSTSFAPRSPDPGKSASQAPQRYHSSNLAHLGR